MFPIRKCNFALREPHAPPKRLWSASTRAGCRMGNSSTTDVPTRSETSCMWRIVSVLSESACGNLGLEPHVDCIYAVNGHGIQYEEGDRWLIECSQQACESKRKVVLSVYSASHGSTREVEVSPGDKGALGLKLVFELPVTCGFRITEVLPLGGDVFRAGRDVILGTDSAVFKGSESLEQLFKELGANEMETLNLVVLDCFWQRIRIVQVAFRAIVGVSKRIETEWIADVALLKN